MSSSSLLRERSRNFPKLLCNLSFFRSMGGGPRTFPGGLNKWQYKRMHEKLAKEKERKLLEQEKQLYQARLRSQIRAKIAGTPPHSDDPCSSGYGPMTPKEHVKALADRFMKDGAEDLWNEDDGPLHSGRRPRPQHSDSTPPLDLRKIADQRNLADCWSASTSPAIMQFEKRRNFSVEAGRGPKSRLMFRPKYDSDSGFGPQDDLVKPFGGKQSIGSHQEIGGKFRIPRVSFEKGDTDDESLDFGGGRIRKKMMCGAALMNYDKKKMRRVPKPVEAESGSTEQIQIIRDQLKKRVMGVAEARQHEVEQESVLTQKRFDEYNISPLTIKALTSAGYERMTVVQEASLPVCLVGKDALVKAKTGTGKSAAFLLPAIEAVLKATSSSLNQRVPPIFALVLCPTRELASQLAAEANVLLKYHDGIGVQTLIGGTRFKVDQKRLESNPCQIIVATPGRLLDHIENRSGFSVRLMGLKVLVLDEADHLLDLGFRKDIEKIVDCVPRQRQSLLFSATIPKEVRRISQLVLKREHNFIDTVGMGGQETPAKVLQSYLVGPHEQHFQIVHHLLKEHIMQEVDYKVIVFCTTAMVTSLMFLLLRDLKLNVREVHSRKPQLYRTRISDEFRESKRLVLVTSDVSARGMNYPDVTLVIQLGIPSDREQYIHRLGRTGREGKNGKGILLIAPWEEHFLDEIKDLPLTKSTVPVVDSLMKQKVEDSMGNIDTSIKEAAYHAWLGYYNSISDIGRDKTMLVDLANRFGASIGLHNPPALLRKTALKMGLKGIPGIRTR